MKILIHLSLSILVILPSFASKSTFSNLDKEVSCKYYQLMKEHTKYDTKKMIAQSSIVNGDSKSTHIKDRNSSNYLETKSNENLQNFIKGLKLAGLFILWYGFNAGYNVYNSYVKRDFKYPLATATAQMIAGLFYAVPLWLVGVRTIPKLIFQDLLKLLPIAMLNAGGHACGVIAMFQTGGGSFTHVIKASEPVMSVILGFIVNHVLPKPLTALSLLPITYGVAYASTLGQINIANIQKELTSKTSIMAMGSNFGVSMRSILRRNLPPDFTQRTNLDPANECAVTTILSVLLTIPLVLYFENLSDIQTSISTMVNKPAFYINLFVCGMCFYLYNEMQNIVLSSLGPLSTAVGNTLKRVVIFAALYLFTSGETFPLPKVVGCAIAVAGCLAFAIFDAKKL
eukprot:gene4679-6573_t